MANMQTSCKRESADWRWLGAVLVLAVAIVLYFASIGPAYWWAYNFGGFTAYHALEVAYAPVYAAGD